MHVPFELRKIAEFIGHHDLRSLKLLHYLVKYLQPTLVVEFGTGYACSTIFMALALDKGVIVSIDCHLDQAENIRIPRANVRRCGVANKVFLRTGNTFLSGDIVKEAFPGRVPDFLFMDASHRWEKLWREYHSIKSLLAPDHVIVIDDMNAHDTQDFAEELAKESRYPVFQKLPFHDGVAVIATGASHYPEILGKAIMMAKED